MKIAQVITRMNLGGAQESVLLTCIGHIEKGHDVTLITGPSEGPEGKLLDKMSVPPELKIIEIPDLVREIQPLTDWRAYRTLRDIFRKNHYDVVHTNSSKAGIIGRAAAWKEHVPLVVHAVHGQAFHQYEKPWKNAVYIAAERFAAKRCHKIYAVAEAMIKQCVDAGVAPLEKYQVVYTGMDLQRFIETKRDFALRRRLGIPENALVVGTIARLFPLKGYEQLIPAAILAAQQNPNLYFLFLGDGIMRPDIEKTIAEANLTPRFILTGMIPPDDIPAHVAQMDMLAHFSLREGLPRGVVQALAAGKPVTAFALDGTPEVVIHHETGLLLDPSDSTETLTRAMLSILENPELRQKMGENGQRKVTRQFDWRFMCDTLLESYQTLLAAQEHDI